MATLTGTESALAASMKSMIQAKLTAATGKDMLAPAYLQALCEGIAEAIIPHLVSNVMVNPGQAVVSAGVTGPTAAPGAPTPILALSGAVSTPGTIS